MSAFEAALKHTLGIEGDYSDDPQDRGGKTRYGITEATARAFGYTGLMHKLPMTLAVKIYQENYWNLLKLDHVALLSEDVAAELFDTSVNLGTSFAGKSFQRCLSAFNRQGKDYPDLVIDGLIGRVTLFAYEAYMARRGLKGEKVLLRALNALQGAEYIAIVESRPSQEKFSFGWFDQRVNGESDGKEGS